MLFTSSYNVDTISVFLKMYFLSKLICILSILHFSSARPKNPSEWDKQSVAECQQLLQAKHLVTPVPNSKYITLKHVNVTFAILAGYNGNFGYYQKYCEFYNLEMPYTSHYTDWVSLQNLCKVYYNSQEFKTLNTNDTYTLYQTGDYSVTFLVTGMEFKYVQPNKPQGTFQDYDTSAKPFVLYENEEPIKGGGVFLGLVKSKVNSGFKENMVAQIMKREAYADATSYTTFRFPVVCMYPSSSKCFKMSQEETDLRGNEKADSLFYMTEAFRGYWNIASKPRTREAGAKYCADNNAGYILNSSIHDLPLTKGMSFEWNLNRIYETFTATLRDHLDLFPFVGFHGREGYEYYFAYNTSLFAGDPQYIFSASFQPPLLERLIHKNAGQFYATERIVVCYKPSKCAE